MSDAILTPATANWLSFALSYLLLAVVPGPNFLVVSDAGLTSKGSDALSAAFGIALGACFLSVLVALAASFVVIEAVTARAVAMLFGFYLIFLGLRSWGRAGALRKLMHMRPAPPSSGYFRMAFLTAVANPTTAIFVGSFGLSMRPEQGNGEIAVIPVTVFLVALFWFSLVGMTFSRWRHTTIAERLTGWRDFAFGVAFILLGGLAILSAQ